MDTNCVELKDGDGTLIEIDCLTIEDEATKNMGIIADDTSLSQRP